MRKLHSPWIDCLVWLFVGWLAGLAATMAVALLVETTDPLPWLRSILHVAPNVAGTGIVVLVGLSATRVRPREVLSLRPPPWLSLPWVAVSSFSLALLAAVLNTWIDTILPMPPEIVALFERVLEYHSVSQFLSVLFFLVIVAPITEELMFRGLFLHRLSEGYGRFRAVLGSALCFGIFHILPWQAIGAVLVGVYLGWLLVRTGSIFVPMAAHAFFNLIPVLATGLAERVPSLQRLGTGTDLEPLSIPPALLLSAMAALVLGVLGTLRTTRAPDPSPRPVSPSEPSPPWPAQDS